MYYHSPKTSSHHASFIPSLSPAALPKQSGFVCSRLNCGRGCCGWSPAFPWQNTTFLNHQPSRSHMAHTSLDAWACAVSCLMPVSSGGGSEMGRLQENGLSRRHPMGCSVSCGFKAINERKIAPDYGQCEGHLISVSILTLGRELSVHLPWAGRC